MGMDTDQLRRQAESSNASETLKECANEIDRLRSALTKIASNRWMDHTVEAEIARKALEH